jgi:hypothetical protein
MQEEAARNAVPDTAPPAATPPKSLALTLAARTAALFNAHPHSLGESYLEHLWATVKLASHFLFAVIVILIHGLFPFLCTTTASRQIEKIYRKMKKRNSEYTPK